MLHTAHISNSSYVPPELEGTYSANQVSGKHALGARARKSGQGILTVRFEMPFAVWCTTCPKPTIIGQGVRFNAEKRKAGNYHSTPIWAFRMKHIVCDGWIEVQTDPKNTDYVVTEGGRRRDTGEDKVREGDVEIRSEEEKRRLQEDAFAALEVKIEDRRVADADKVRIEELYAARERDWEDPYTVNKRVRRGFRADRKDKEKREASTEELKAKMSLGIELLDETDEDRQRAAAAEFGPDISVGDPSVVLATSRPLFSRNGNTTSDAGSNLRHTLARNTRTNLDIFGVSSRGDESVSFPGVKRKRTENLTSADEKSAASTTNEQPKPAKVLVEYDSD